jgi:hypothetical protein
MGMWWASHSLSSSLHCVLLQSVSLPARPSDGLCMKRVEPRLCPVSSFKWGELVCLKLLIYLELIVTWKIDFSEGGWGYCVQVLFVSFVKIRLAIATEWTQDDRFFVCQQITKQQPRLIHIASMSCRCPPNIVSQSSAISFYNCCWFADRGGFVLRRFHLCLRCSTTCFVESSVSTIRLASSLGLELHRFTPDLGLSLHLVSQLKIEPKLSRSFHAFIPGLILSLAADDGPTTGE